MSLNKLLVAGVAGLALTATMAEAAPRKGDAYGVPAFQGRDFLTRSPSAFGSRSIIDARMANQARRITAGLLDGSLTRPEYHALKAQQSQIAGAVRAAASDGYIAPWEEKLIRRMQDHADRTIFAERHDAQRRGWHRFGGFGLLRQPF